MFWSYFFFETSMFPKMVLELLQGALLILSQAKNQYKTKLNLPAPQTFASWSTLRLITFTNINRIYFKTTSYIWGKER